MNEQTKAKEVVCLVKIFIFRECMCYSRLQFDDRFDSSIKIQVIKRTSDK